MLNRDSRADGRRDGGGREGGRRQSRGLAAPRGGKGGVGVEGSQREERQSAEGESVLPLLQSQRAGEERADCGRRRSGMNVEICRIYLGLRTFPHCVHMGNNCVLLPAVGKQSATFTQIDTT